VQRLQAFVHRQCTGYRTGIREQTGIAYGEGDLRQRRVPTEPVRAGPAVREIGAELAAEISVRNDADIDFIAEFGEDPRSRVSDAVSTRFVDPGSHADILFNAVGQPDQLLALQVGGQIAGIRVLVGDPLDQRRIVPRLQVGADFASTRTIEIADELVGFPRAADRVIEDEGRPDSISVKDPLCSILAFNRGTPIARRGVLASQSNSASVSTMTTSIGV
jgi:hypothetical protein